MLGKGLDHAECRAVVVVAGESGWPVVTVGEGTSTVFIGDRPAAMCSESEKWRAQAALQLTLAAMTGSKVVVLDRADLLDTEGRQGLGRALGRVATKTGIAMLICSTWTGAPIANADNFTGIWGSVTIENGVTA